MRFIFFILLFIGLIQAYSQTITVSGNAPSYAGDTIRLLAYEDYITLTEFELARCTVDDTGAFSLEFVQDHTIFAHIPLGTCTGLIFLQPGEKYSIILPEKKTLAVSDVVNPYFVPEKVYLGINNSHRDELNFLVKKFDYFYDAYLEDNFYTLYKLGYNSKVDTFITKITDFFSFADNSWFSDYMTYKIAYLRNMAYERDRLFVTHKYFDNQPVLYDNPAYMEMFSQLYRHFFSYYSRTNEGAGLYDAIAKAKSVWYLKKSLSFDISLTNDTLQELVILQGINDAFYPSPLSNVITFPRKQLLQTLDSMILLTNIPEHRKIAVNIKEKVTTRLLAAGDEMPDFLLYSSNSIPVKSSVLKGKYTYLAFYSQLSFSCQQDILLMDNLIKKYGDQLQVVTIFCDGTFKSMCDFLSEYKFDRVFLHYGNQPEILVRYNVSAYPTYYLVDPYGKIVLAPAPAPADNFDKAFANVLKNRN